MSKKNAKTAPEAVAETAPEAVAEKKSIIPSKYAEAYKERGADWVGEQIAANCVTETKNEKGKVTSNLDVALLFGLAEANGINVAKYEEQVDRPNAPGRLRMTIGNMLRARVKRRHGMYSTSAKWSDAPEDFLKAISAPEKPTEKRDGEKIVVAKSKVVKEDVAEGDANTRVDAAPTHETNEAAAVA